MAEIPEQGMDRQALFESMRQHRRDDVRWREGRTFAHVYDAGREAEEVGRIAYTELLAENALDPTGFPSLVRFETELVGMVRSHLGGDEKVTGNFTSGGTESILLAVKAARDQARSKRPELAGQPLQIVLPTTAHAAFHKAAHFLGLELVQVDVDPHSFKADASLMSAALTDHTIMLVASTPCWSHGVIDPVEALAELAQERDLWLHVDACVGGFLLPYFRRLGQPVPPFDFAVPGVSSLSVDLHKYAFAPKGASLVLYRDKSLRRHQIFGCAEWTGYAVVNPTVQSSRTGGAVAAAWAVVQHLGEDGYLELAQRVLEGTRTLRAGVQRMDALRILGDPEFSLMAVASDEVSVFHLADELLARGWHVQPQFAYANSPANIHLFVMPGNAANVDALVSDLDDAVEAARAVQTDPLVDQVRATMAGLDPSAIDPALFGQMLAMAGVEGSELPERMGDINELLNSLPAVLRRELIVEFFNDLYTPP